MDEMQTAQEPDLAADGLLFNHEGCTTCGPPSVSTHHLRADARKMLDAMGDMQFFLVRENTTTCEWSLQVRVFSVGAGPGATWDVEHWAGAGVPTYFPPNCPEWLWVMYTALGDMCSHFMDRHDDEPITAMDPDDLR